MQLTETQFEERFYITARRVETKGAEPLYVVNFHAYWEDGKYGPPETVVQIEFDKDTNRLYSVNRPIQADKSKYGELWDRRIMPIAEKRIRALMATES